MDGNFDCMERAGAEQARRADQNQSDLIAANARISALEAEVARFRLNGENLWRVLEDRKVALNNVHANLKESRAKVALLEGRVKSLEAFVRAWEGYRTDSSRENHIQLMSARAAVGPLPPAEGEEPCKAKS
jgi:hypothetical protein